MPILSPLALSFPRNEVSALLRRTGSGEGEGVVRDWLERVNPLITPRAYYKPAFIAGRSESKINFGRATFTSRVLRRNLDAVERVFPYVITIGADLERTAGESGDLLEQYTLEILGDLALSEARKELERRIQERFGVAGLSGMSPGSLQDWPLSEQRGLFALLGDVETSIGVRLTDSLLMVPRKSISGLLFPSESTFLSCRLCPRDRCPGRKAEYDAALRSEYGLTEEQEN